MESTISESILGIKSDFPSKNPAYLQPFFFKLVLGLYRNGKLKMPMKIRFITHHPFSWPGWPAEMPNTSWWLTSAYYSLHGSKENTFRTPVADLGAIYESWCFCIAPKTGAAIFFIKQVNIYLLEQMQTHFLFCFFCFSAFFFFKKKKAKRFSAYFQSVSQLIASVLKSVLLRSTPWHLGDWGI